MFRVGFGFDSHRLKHGGPLRLGGSDVPGPVSTDAHSDGDVLLHALTDALLGAVAAPDIGSLFPPGDPKTRGTDSRVFLAEALRRVRAAGYRVVNCDTTVVADEPKLGPHKHIIAEAVAALLSLDVSAVSIKAKSTEGLPPGAQGIAAHAVVLIERSEERQ